MTAVWITVGVLCVGTFALKAIGPLTLGNRTLSPRAASVIGLLAPALLAGLVLYETCSASGSGISFDARIVGLAGAGVALALRAPLLVVVLVAAVVTALTRALF